MSKWYVELECRKFSGVEVEADTEEEAMEVAEAGLDYDWEATDAFEMREDGYYE